MSTKDGFKKAESIGAMFQECSAKTGENIKEFFKLVLGTLIDSAEAKNAEEEGNDEDQGVDLEKGIKKKTKEGEQPNRKLCCK